MCPQSPFHAPSVVRLLSPVTHDSNHPLPATQAERWWSSFCALDQRILDVLHHSPPWLPTTSYPCAGGAPVDQLHGAGPAHPGHLLLVVRLQRVPGRHARRLHLLPVPRCAAGPRCAALMKSVILFRSSPLKHTDNDIFSKFRIALKNTLDEMSQWIPSLSLVRCAAGALRGAHPQENLRRAVGRPPTQQACKSCKNVRSPLLAVATRTDREHHRHCAANELELLHQLREFLKRNMHVDADRTAAAWTCIAKVRHLTNSLFCAHRS